MFCVAITQKCGTKRGNSSLKERVEGGIVSEEES
jgi:hypothetical protein